MVEAMVEAMMSSQYSAPIYETIVHGVTVRHASMQDALAYLSKELEVALEHVEFLAALTAAQADIIKGLSQ